MKEYLKSFVDAYEQWVHDTEQGINTTVYFNQFIENYLRDHPLPLPSDEEIAEKAKGEQKKQPKTRRKKNTETAETTGVEE